MIMAATDVQTTITAMARTGITFDDVARTANELLSRGENPTIQRIREQLGSGSNTTIANHLRRWQHARREASMPALPPTVPEGLMPALETFWQSATREAHALFEMEREAFRSELEDARLAYEEAQYTLQRLEQEHSELGQRLHQTTEQLEEQAQTLDRERTTRQHLEADLRAAAERQTGLEEALREARAALEALKARHRDELAEWHKQHEQRLLDERQRNEAESTRLLQLLDESRRETKQAQQQAREELDRARERWDQQTAALEQRSNERLQALEASRDQEREARRSSEQQYAELRGRVAQQGEMIERLERKATDAHQRELTVGRDNERLSQQLARAEEETQQLRDALEHYREDRETKRSDGKKTVAGD